MPSQKLKPLKQLVVPKAKEPRLIINLEEALATKTDREETVATYIFTHTLKEQFLSVLDRLQERRGGGFWVQAEYGSGKTHFLSTLASLLVDPSKDLWDKVDDNEVRRRRDILGTIKLFPVVRSLRGEAQAADGVARPETTLMQVLLRTFDASLRQLSLRDRISLTSDDDVLQWLKQQGAGTRSDISRYIANKSGEPLPDHPEDHSEGKEAVCALIRRYWQEHGTPDPTPTSYKDRFTWIYRQLRREGFDGLLILLDEFAFWQDMHPTGSQGAAHDEEILETLADVLPKTKVDGERVNITIVVASQKPAPAKLQERFNRIVLLADREQSARGVREYDVIATQRVRELAKEREPELREFFNFYRNGFKFLRHLAFDDFRRIFPFHPRCFEYLRRIMEREMPTARSAIKVLWQVLTSTPCLDEPRLLLPSDLLAAPEMQALSGTTVYQAAFRSYGDALRHFEGLDMGRNKELGRWLLDTLFLIHLTYLDITKSTKAEELAEMVAAQHEILSGADAVETPLAQLHEGLDPVVTYKEGGAKFQPAGRLEETPETLFKVERSKITDRSKILEAWVEALSLSGSETMGHRMLFDTLTPEQLKELTVAHPNIPIEYEGEVVFTKSWSNSLLTMALPPDNGSRNRRHFRIVFLAQKEEVQPDDLQDERIAVCVPAELRQGTVAYEAARDLATVKAMEERYGSDESDSGRRSYRWLRDEKRRAVMEVISNRQRSLYLNGDIVTKKGLGIDPKAVLHGREREFFAALAQKLVLSAYDKLGELVDADHIKKPLKPAGAKQVFEAFALQEKITGNASLTSALTNYAVGLGLATQNRPQEFQPVNCKVFERMRTLMADGAVATHQIYQQLTRPPYGLTEELVTLYLLLFLRAGNPPAEFTNFRSGTVNMKNDIPTPTTLHFDNVFMVEWGKSLWANQNLGTLARRKEKQWNDVVPWGKCLVPDLETRNNLADVPPQEGLLLNKLKDLHAEVPVVKDNLGQLCKVFTSQLPVDNETALAAMEAVANAKNFREFHARATEQHGDDPNLFKSTVETYERLKLLANRAATVQRVKGYLDQVVLPDTEHQLTIERLSLQGQLSFNGLLKKPRQIDALSEWFERFLHEYEPLYQKHHRDVHKSRETLLRQVQQATERVSALTQLNTITELGRPHGSQLSTEQQQLLRELEVCPKAKENDGIIAVTAEPICPSCKLTLKDSTPEERVNQFLQALDEALEEKYTALRRELTEQILRTADQDRLRALLDILQLGQLDNLPNVLSEELVQYLRQLLQNAGLQTVNINFIARMPSDLHSIEETQIPAAVNAFEKALHEAFAEAKTQNPDATKIKISLR